ncbi:MAG: hypothetical protein WCS28_11775 [Thiomicrospira sp.]
MIVGNDGLNTVRAMYGMVDQMRIYAGTLPTVAQLSTPPGTLLVDFQNDIQNASDNSFFINASKQVQWLFYDMNGERSYAQADAINSGTAGFFWLTVVSDNYDYSTIAGTIGGIGSGADLELPSTSIAAGDVVKFQSLIINLDIFS